MWQPPKLRSIRKFHLFEEQMKEFGEPEITDEALEAVEWALARNAEFFENIPGTHYRRVRLDDYERGGVVVPALRIWYTILDEDTVLLVSVSRIVYDDFFDDDLLDDGF